MTNQPATNECTYVIYCYPGVETFGNLEEVADRNPQREAESAPSTAYSFLYCSLDGSNQSKIYYIDGIVYDARYIGLNWRDGHDILRRTIGSSNITELVHCRNGKWEPFSDEYAEVVVAVVP